MHYSVASVQTLTNQLGPVQKRMSQLEEEKVQLAQERDETDMVNRTEVQNIRAEEDSIKNATGHIKKYCNTNKLIHVHTAYVCIHICIQTLSYVNSGSVKAISDCEARLEELSKKQQTMDSEKKEVEEKIYELQKQLANARVRERELGDNLLLLRQQDDIEQKDREIKKLKEKLRSMGLDRFEE